MKRVLAILLALLLCVALSVGCAADEPTPTPAETPAEEAADEPAEEPADEPAEEPVDEPAEEPADEPAEEPAGDIIEIRVPWWGDTVRHELYNQILDNFEAANPDIVTIREPQSWGDYWDRLTVQAAGGNAPDFIGMNTFFAGDYIYRGVLAPLDPFIDRGIIDLSGFPQGVIDTGIVNGVTYMVIMGVNFSAILVNDDLIAELGVEEPEFEMTWDELIAYATEVRQAMDAAGMNNAWPLSDFSDTLQQLRFFLTPQELDVYTADGELGFDAETLEQFWGMWSDMRDQNLIVDAATRTEFAGVPLQDSLFAHQRVAMITIPAGQFRLHNEMLDFSSSMIRYPTVAGGTGATVPEGSHFSISAQSPPEKQEAAARLLNFWVNDEASLSLFLLDQGVPGNQAMHDVIIPLLDDYQRATLDYVAFMSQFGVSRNLWPAGTSEVESLFALTSEEIAFGVTDPVTAARAFVEAAMNILD